MRDILICGRVILAFVGIYVIWTITSLLFSSSLASYKTFSTLHGPKDLGADLTMKLSAAEERT